MNQAETLSCITHLEKEFPVEKISFNGHLVWPLIRLELVSSLTRPAGKKEIVSCTRVERLKNLLERRQWIRRVRSGVFLFFFDQSSKYTKRNGELFHRFFDPLRDELEQGIDYRIIQWKDDLTEGFGETEGSINLGEAYQIARVEAAFLAKRSGPLGKDLLDLLNKWSALTGVVLNPQSLTMTLFLHTKLYEILRAAFQGTKPLLFVTCFYSIPAFAATAAVQSLGGKVVEIQHGQQGDCHPMYTNWIGKGGVTYEMIPELFWMWNQRGVARIEAWGKEFGISAIEGGNTWMGYFEEKMSQKSREATDQKRIVYSMQFTELPDFIWDSVITNDELYWVFRMHPRFVADFDKFKEQCDERLSGMSNWEIDCGEMDFYEAISDASVHLTGWSTTAFEALHFGVPTVIVHPNGKTSMAKEIQEGVFSYADSVEDLFSAIEKRGMRRAGESEILADLSRSKELFSRLLKESSC